MSTRTSYTAAFSDGKVLTRKSHREYAACYRWYGSRVEDGRAVHGAGWSRTRELAAKALRSDTSWNGFKVDFSEITEARKT
jgi:hypothetical protein